MDIASRFGRTDPANWQVANTSPLPLDRVVAQEESYFSNLQLALGIAMAVLFGVALVGGVFVLKRNIRGNLISGINLTNLDYFFRLSHFTPAGEPVMAYISCFGALLSVLTTTIIVLVGVLLVLQNLVTRPSSTVTTARLEYEPTGLYQVQVVVSGYGLLAACASNNITISIDDVNTIVGTPEAVPNAYTVDDNACLLTWRCPGCQLSTGSVPSFTVTTTSLVWVNFYYYNVTAPVMVTRTGGQFDRNPVALSVSQLMFPTTDPVNDRVAFRSYYADQSVNILMTGTAVVDNRPNTPVAYTSYQPSILSIAKRQATLNGPQAYMTDQSPIVPPMGQPAGFKLQIVFQRNTIIVTRY